MISNLRSIIIKRGKKSRVRIGKRKANTESRKEVGAGAEAKVGIGIETDREERTVRVVVISRTGNGIDRGLIRVVVRVKVNIITRANIIGVILDLGQGQLIKHHRGSNPTKIILSQTRFPTVLK
jgi:hypothetical protein